MQRRFLLAVLAPLLLLSAATTAGAQSARPAWIAPPEPAVRPELPSRGEIDADDNRIDDRLDREIGALRRDLASERDPVRRGRLAADLAAPVRVELVFTGQVTQQQIDAFDAAGGTIEHLYRAVSYGWSGTLARSAVDSLPTALGAALLVVAADVPAELHMDEATRTGRVRPVWATGFAGSGSGFSGTSDITIGVLDSGVDDSHTDLAGRLEYWKDFTGDAEPTPRDVIQHGSHVAGIATGTGAAFGDGPGDLHFTDSENLSGFSGGRFFIGNVHLPAASVLYSENATWAGGGSGSLRLAFRLNGNTGGFFSLATTLTGPSPLVLDTTVDGNPNQVYTSVLPQNQQKTIGPYAIVNTVTGYPAVGDGFAAMRGVAPGARWAAGKVFANNGASSAAILAAGMDDFVAQRVAHNIKVVNMSFGLGGSPGLDPTLRAKANTMVSNGIVVVSSAGNDGPGSALANQVDDPGRAALVLTVGASNDINALTEYSSCGFPSPSSSEDNKPDLLAPGGSDYYSYIMSVDSNDADGGVTTFADRVANDYYSIKGTSMSAPFAAGAAALVVDAMQQAGTTWTFASSAQPLLVKMLLSASATETNAAREVASGTNPSLGRASAPKDLFEGYGLINPDAAVEAVSQTWSGEHLVESSDGGVVDPRAWGRTFGISSDFAVTVTLAVPPTADYDLYLYSGTPDAKGNPVIRKSSTKAGLDVDESITFLPSKAETQYVFVKRVSGSGEWSLDGFDAVAVCGDNLLEVGETCEDGNSVGGDCCSAVCVSEPEGGPCSDGLFCTATDVCVSGVCIGSGDPCVGGAECNVSCNEAADNCATAAGTPCSSDANPCSLDQCNGAGACAHPPGNAGALCREVAGVCDVQETCTGASTSCPANLFTSTAAVCRGSSGVCDTVERCTGSAAACPADTYASTATLCRASTTTCDAAEVCTGTGVECPADGVAATNVLCRVAVSACDVAETCSGTSQLCPSDVFAATSTLCRTSAGVCDPTENCTGLDAVCPPNGFSASTTVCRAVAGVCDSAETCTGSTPLCPSDRFVASTTVCRASVDVCDVTERCNGVQAECPADGFAHSSTLCRTSVALCDADERCTGSSTACPADAPAASSTICRIAVSTCDTTERCTGTGMACPTDGFAATGVVCRAVAGVCDIVESCTGNSAACPADAFSATTLCRPANGVCDVAETCSGAAAACPADTFAPTSVGCRGANGVCDVAESCSGTAAGCPANGFASAFVICRSASGPCDAAEHCTSTSTVCPADALAGTGVVCRTDTDQCDVFETCSGTSKACPPDKLADANTPCLGDGLACTRDVCSGSSPACTHVAGNAGMVCRAAEGICDVAETCSGSGTECPADGAAPTTTVCRTGAGECDAAERCDGIAKACPANAFKPSGTTCTSDGKVCTTDACDGASAACRHPAGSDPCDDGLFCNGADSCSAGTCSVHAGDPCSGADGDDDCTETCSEATNSCTAADPNGSPCDDGEPCTSADACHSGVCSGEFTAGEGCEVTTTTLPPAECGDTNADGKIAAGDALFALRASVGTATCALELCDYNGDGRIAASDALAILRKAVGLPVTAKCPAAAADVDVPSTIAPTTTLGAR